MGAGGGLKKLYPHLRIDWLTKSEFAPLFEGREDSHRVIAFSSSQGLMGLFRLALRLRKERYDFIYDAHSNLRSFFLRWILATGNKTKWVRRPKERWKRFLLFQFKINYFPPTF